MNFRLFILNLFFTNCFLSFVFSSEIQNIEMLKVSNISQERVEIKIEFFKNIFEKSRKFRQAVYFTSAASVLGVGAYYGYKYGCEFFNKNDSSSTSSSEGANADAAKKDTSTNEASKSKNGTSSNGESNLNDYLNKLKTKDYILKKDGFWVFMRHEFNKGMGIALATALVTPLFVIQSRMWEYFSDKFMQLWNGNEKERFLLIQRQLGTNIDLLYLFFKNDELVCDKSEICDNYSVFIDSLETLIAFILAKLEQIQSDQQDLSLTAIFNAQANLISKIDSFSDEFQNVLNKTDKNFGVEQANLLWIPFKQLNNQLIRFSNLCFSVFYENN